MFIKNKSSDTPYISRIRHPVYLSKFPKTPFVRYTGISRNGKSLEIYGYLYTDNIPYNPGLPGKTWLAPGRPPWTDSPNRQGKKLNNATKEERWQNQSSLPVLPQKWNTAIIPTRICRWTSIFAIQSWIHTPYSPAHMTTAPRISPVFASWEWIWSGFTPLLKSETRNMIWSVTAFFIITWNHQLKFTMRQWYRFFVFPGWL